MNWIDEYENENRLNPQTRKPAEYCTVIVANGYSQTGGKYWWWMLEGEEMFCKIKRDDRGEIKEYFPCKLTNSKILIGRPILAQECIMI